MAITTAKATSRRGYLSQDELEQFANISVTDTSEADDVISQAEELIDAFVGFQEMFMPEPLEGLAAAGGASSLTLESDQQNNYDANYFQNCEIEILGGTGEGERNRILSSTKAGVLTMADAWDTTPSTDSFYRIYQLGKFPRIYDVVSNTVSGTSTYYKSIPEAVKRAVAAQVEYIINMGDDFFRTDKADKTSESIGDYSYSTKEGRAGVMRLIAPKAKLLLRGYINRVGQITT